MSTFQIIIIAIFVAFAVIGVIVFAGFGGLGGGGDNIGKIVIWGTLDRRAMDDVINEIRLAREDFSGVTYVEKDARTYGTEFVDALAAGRGPDLFLLSQDAILSNQDKILEVPFESFSKRAFKDTFIEEGELYLTSSGVLGLPFSVDPLVLYWNRNIFSNNGLASPPKYWDEFFALSTRITKRDQASNILQSFAALGEFRNIVHAKEILSILIMQAGNPIVALGDISGMPESTIADNRGFATSPAEAALRFYTEFSNPVKTVYSWNRALPDSRQSFLAGDLSLYIGFASELLELRRANPNLNFAVTELPQLKDAEVNMTFGKMLAFAVPRTSRNPSSAFTVAAVLTSASPLASLAGASGLPPVRRDLLSQTQSDDILSVFYNSAILSRAWLDPGDIETDGIFRDMIESTISGKARLSEAVRVAEEEINALLQK